MSLIRVNADLVIDTDDDPQTVCGTLQQRSFIQEWSEVFPHGEILKVEVLSQDDVETEELDWVAD